MVLRWRRRGRVGSCSVFFMQILADYTQMNTDKKCVIVVSFISFFLHINAFAQMPQEHFQRGRMFYLDLKPEQAEVEFKKALRLNPQLFDAHYYLGSIYFKQSRYPEAIEQCKAALRINPKDVKSLIILGLSFQQMELFDQAISAFEQAADIDVRCAAAHSALGLAYCANGDIARAKEEYNILKKIDVELAEDLLRKIKISQATIKE